MKLTDKRFWKFEALMLLCGMISIVINPLLYTFGKMSIGKIIYLDCIFFYLS